MLRIDASPIPYHTKVFWNDWQLGLVNELVISTDGIKIVFNAINYLSAPHEVNEWREQMISEMVAAGIVVEYLNTATE